MLNEVRLIGNLGRDPELRSTASGTSVATLSVATEFVKTDRDGNKDKETEWHRVIAWASAAEFAGNYLKKGSRVYVAGRLKTSSWDDKDTGEKKYRTEIVAQRLIGLDKKGDDDDVPF